MALAAVASFFRADATQCLAKCDKPNFDKLTATKCSHVFCEVCIRKWIVENKKETCPTCVGPVRSEDNEPYKDFLARVTYYARHDPKTLEEKLQLEKIYRVSCCQIKIDEKSQRDKGDESCSICSETSFPYVYFIIKDKASAKVGHYVHGDCLQIVKKDSLIQDFSLHELVKVAKKLPWPPPSKPASPLRVIFLLIILPVSVWALAMNSRIYRNNNVILFVLSIPALLIFKMFFLILSGIKKIFTEKSA